jgi:hypothetical protein
MQLQSRPDQLRCQEKPFQGASCSAAGVSGMQQDLCQINTVVVRSPRTTVPATPHACSNSPARSTPQCCWRVTTQAPCNASAITSMQQQSCQINTDVVEVSLAIPAASYACSNSPAKSIPVLKQAPLVHPAAAPPDQHQLGNKPLPTPSNACIDSPAKSNTSVEGNPLATSAPSHTCSNSPVRSIPLFEHVLATPPP